MGCLGRRFAIGKEGLLMHPSSLDGRYCNGVQPGTTPLASPTLLLASDNVGGQVVPHAAQGKPKPKLIEGVETEKNIPEDREY